MDTRPFLRRVPDRPLRRSRPLFNAEFPAGMNSYRAYRLPWFPGGGDSHRG